MNGRRALGEMLTEIAAGTLDALSSAPDLRVRRLALTLPVEVGLRRVGEKSEILGDLSRSVTRTDFDTRPSRLVVVWEEQETL